MVQLLRHPCACMVVDDIYTLLKADQRDALVAEFYGPEFSLFDGNAPRNLAAVFEGHGPSKRRGVMQHLSQQIHPLVEKMLVDAVPTQRALSEYMQHATPLEIYDVAELLCGPALLRLCHTQDGARVACMCVAAGTAKDRKKVVKAMKGHVGKMVADEWAHTVIMTLLSMTDDTKLLVKSIIPEVIEVLPEVVSHKHGRRVVLQLLSTDVSSYVPGWMQGWIHPAEVTVTAATAIDAKRRELQDEHGDKTTGKIHGLPEGMRMEDTMPPPKRKGTVTEEASDGDDDGSDDGGGNGGGHSDSGDDDESDGAMDDDFDGSDGGDDEGEGGGALWSDGEDEEEGAEAGAGGAEGIDVDDDEEGGGWRVGAINVAKKDADLRRAEVLGQGKGSLADAVVQEVAGRAKELLTDVQGADVVAEVARGGAGNVLGGQCGCDLSAVWEAVAGAMSSAEVLENFFAGRAIR